MIVELSPGEVRLAVAAGTERQIQNLTLGRRERYGAAGTFGAWDRHIQGAGAELAIAKRFNRFWSGALGELEACDVDNTDVRQSADSNACLILHPGDPDDRVFFLVTGTIPEFTLRGWILARDGKRKEYWKDPTGKGRSAFFVPQSALEPVMTAKSRRTC